MTRSNSRPLTRIATAVALVTAVALLPGCEDDPRVDDLQSRVGELARQVESVSGDNAKIERKLAAAQDRIADLEQGIGELRMERLAAVGEAAEAVVPGVEPMAGASSTAAGSVPTEVTQLRRMLQDESARAALAEALETERRERRSEREDERLSRFAERAGLSTDQAERLGQLLSENRQQMRDLFEAGRAQDDREGTRAAIEELRSALDENVKALLSDDQYTQFKESRIASPGGRRRGGGARDRGAGTGGRQGR